MASLCRFTHLVQLDDLEQAIQREGHATSTDRPDMSGWLNNLGGFFITRSEHLGKVDLEQAVSKYKAVIDLTPDRNATKPRHLSHLGKLNVLDQAISLFRDASDLAPEANYNRPAYPPLSELVSGISTS